MKILGIETSCDETAAAVVEDGHRLLSSVVASSLDLHKAYGGVVPEIAARSHLESILAVIKEALNQAGCKWSDIDAIAVTKGPGLIGCLLIGVLTARTLAIAKNKPLIPVNHVQAHPYGAFIEAKPRFPFLALIVSGGHTQLVLYKSHRDYQLIAQTSDDAVGEAFDKVAKILGLPYPGGPSVSQAAKHGKPNFKLPNVTPKGTSFSFSGLKTAVLRAAQTAVGADYTLPSTELPARLKSAQKADLARSFEETAVKALVNSLKQAVDNHSPADIVVAGGVASNTVLRQEVLKAFPKAIFPSLHLCTDNAAMIASLGFFLADSPVDPFKLMVEPNLAM